MKVSKNWLLKYFSEPLPDTEELVAALTFHSSEVEEVEEKGGDTVLDVKVLPDRAPYALSHRGIALELAAALNRPLATDPLQTPLPEWPTTTTLVTPLATENAIRHMGALVQGVKVGPSPDWLRDALESVGQRSINNIVDATNYVMLNIGQPVHAFDSGKLTWENEVLSIGIRPTLEGESVDVLSGETYALPEDTLVLCEGEAGKPIDIAGIKGGKASAISETTTNLFVTTANFDDTTIRRTSQALKLWTDASSRFQNKLSPELVPYGMRDVLALILEVAGGEVAGVTDSYPNPQQPHALVSVTLERINGILGTSFTLEEVQSALTRLSLIYATEGEFITITPSFERRDLVTVQDIAEEVGRILGYDRVEPTDLPAMKEAPNQNRFRGIERIKDVLLERGFTEISTQSFAVTGEVILANPLQSDKPALRPSLKEHMEDALQRAAQQAARVLGPEPRVLLFELGTVFANGKEYLSLSLGYRQVTGKPSAAVLEDIVSTLLETFPDSGLVRPDMSNTSVCELSLEAVDLEGIEESYTPNIVSLGAYRPFSIYPFATRDIAIWVPSDTDQSELSLLIAKEAGSLLVRMDLFDRFEKDGRTSYAFRLIFQSSERTLADTDLDPRMTTITNTLNAQEGWEVR